MYSLQLKLPVRQHNEKEWILKSIAYGCFKVLCSVALLCLALTDCNATESSPATAKEEVKGADENPAWWTAVSNGFFRVEKILPIKPSKETGEPNCATTETDDSDCHFNVILIPVPVKNLASYELKLQKKFMAQGKVTTGSTVQIKQRVYGLLLVNQTAGGIPFALMLSNQWQATLQNKNVE